MDSNLVYLELRNSRDSEETPAAMEQALSAFGTGVKHGGILSHILNKQPGRFMSLEIVATSSTIHFFIVAPKALETYIESQITAQYPKALLTPSVDYMPQIISAPHSVSQLVFHSPFYFPLKTFKDTKDVDLLSSVLGQLAKLPVTDSLAIQIWVTAAGPSWQRTALSVVARGVPDLSTNPPRTKNHPQARLIEGKASQTGLLTGVRILASSSALNQAKAIIREFAGTFGVYNLGEGNGLTLHEPHFWQVKKLEQAMIQRSRDLIPRNQIFSAPELASLWHPPGLTLSMIKNISWGARLKSDPPENLPVATEREEDKKLINFFARADFKNKSTTFGLKKEDRRKHLYIIGKTGSGKSTLIANMAINDMRNGEGLAIIDPHGDLSEILLDYIPSYRINDVAYLDPSDTEHPFYLNPFEVETEVQRELVASGIISIFHKLYHYSWGPRLEYILRNTILTLLHVPQSTLMQVPELLTNEKYRSRIVDKLDDQVLVNYWNNEYNQMSQQLRAESVSPILNKVGQFLSGQTIRTIVGHPTSTFNLSEFMDQGKILILNLAQGKLGEDNSALLGAMIITKLQLAAMNRVFRKEEDRRDFYLYVDEFQNFATTSFIKILSEARKYRLNLTLANQYIGQIEEDVQKAIFGNAGSLISFGIGAADARVMTREFGSVYEEDELVGLGNYQIAVKLSINNETSMPFVATTLPLPRSVNQNREKILRSSWERYTKKPE